MGGFNSLNPITMSDNAVIMVKSKINPKINFYEIEYYLKNQSLNPYLIENSEIYNLVKKLTDKVCFSSKDKYEKRWEDFYEL